MKPVIQKTLLVLLLGAGLGACVPLPLLLGGAVAGGVMVASDRRTSGTVVDDNAIQLKASNRIDDNLGERVHVNVTSYNRQALITGEVPTAQDKALAEQMVKGVDNVSTVLNELAVMGNTTFTERSNDAITSGRVKAAIFDAKDLSNNAFKIVTERGVVYVLGRVTAREAKRVTDVVTATPSVKKVVRVLEVISEEELARIAPPANSQK